MKIDLKLIRSLEVIHKPDGRYIRIGYVKPESGLEEAKNKIRQRISQARQSDAVKTIVFAGLATVLYHVAKNLMGM